MSEERDLIEKAITLDLFGLDLPLEDDTPPAPDKYSVIRLLGRGGFGAVYLAHDEVLDRDVALKFLTHARPADLERFRREARFTARLQNPSIVQVYELGEFDGDHFIAMQFIDGTSLADAEVDRDTLVRIVRDVARALNHAHGVGIVHRDIKPENILVDRERRAFLTDFGIARDLEGRAGVTLSQDGMVLGTPALMPPEQARGETHAIDARSDVYSLGATLYTRLTRRRPFERGNLAAVLHAVIHEEPTLPRAFDPGIPRDLEAIVMRCLRKARRDRYQNMVELADELDRLLENEPVLSRPDWFRRLVGAPRPKNETDTHLDPADPTRQEIARQIFAIDADLYRASTLTRVFQRLDAIISRLDAHLELHPDSAWARFHRGMARFRRDRLPEALDDMERSIDRVEDVADASFELGRLYLTLYLREFEVARRHVAMEGFHDHLRTIEGRIGQAVIAFQEAQRHQPDLPKWRLAFVAAVTHLAHGAYDACDAACEAILVEEPDLEEVWKLRGDARELAGLDPFACYDEALAIRRSYYDAHLARARASLVREQHADAIASLERAVRVHPEAADALAMLARVRLETFRLTGDRRPLDEALEAARRARALDDGHYGAAAIGAEILLASAAEDRDESLDEALAWARRARELPGCQNRAQLLEARALLFRARRARQRGDDPRPDLEAVLRLTDGIPCAERESPRWSGIVAEATEVLARG